MTKAKSATAKPAPKKRGRKSGEAINGAAQLMRARFVQEYPKDFHGTNAAIRAGYAATSARTAASRLLADPDIAAQIKAVVEGDLKKIEINRETWLAEVAKVGFFNMGDALHITGDGDPFIDLSKLTREQMAAIAEAEVHDYTEGRGDDARNVRKVKVKAHSKLGALDTIGKHFGFLKEKVEISADTDFFEAMQAALARSKAARK